MNDKNYLNEEEQFKEGINVEEINGINSDKNMKKIAKPILA